MSVGLINLVEVRVEEKLAYLGECDPNERINMGERERGEGGPGTGRYTAEESICAGDEGLWAYMRL